jgi:protein involved in polysaccharide export with SLBB domain
MRLQGARKKWKSNQSIDLASAVGEGIQNMFEINLIKKLAGGVFAVLAIAFMAGCAGLGANPGTMPADGRAGVAPSSDKFNVGDLVIVKFSGTEAVIPDHEEKVKEDGSITLPFIGSVVAQGKGSGELQKEIRARYVEGKIYSASLNVTVKGQERFFFVDGEVRSPNRYVWAEGMSVLKAVSSAGGFTDYARKTRVTVTRLDGRKFSVNCEKAIENPELDLPVYPGDRVLVPRRWI